MPFIRKGLCATDQKKCARLLSQGVPAMEVASRLRTTVDVVKKFTQKKLDEATEVSKKKEKAAMKHAKDTRVTATALAGAAKEILSQVPEDPDFT